jgi:TonB family protein
MTTLIEICGQPAVHALGWTLLHLCWQGTLVAMVLWCVLGVLGGRSSQVRYAVSCLALGLMVALPLATFAHLASAEYRLRATFDGSAIVIDPGMVLQVGAGEMTAPWPVRMSAALDRALPWVLLAWFAGVIFFVGRLNVGLMVARRMRSIATTAVPAELQQAFDGLRRRLGVARAVRLMHSALVQVPTVIGWLRPVVLIPASCLTGMSAMQIEAILAHELAHIRRHDYLVSVMQSVIETLLFYHPAVWWVSRQVRRERECCCDELAVAVGGDRLAYARALSVLEERRACTSEFVLGANGGVLTMRIRRLLGCKEDAAVSQFAAYTVLAILVVVAGSYVVTAARAEASAMSRAGRGASPMEVESATPLNTLIASPKVRQFQLKAPVMMAQAEAPPAPASPSLSPPRSFDQLVPATLDGPAHDLGPGYGMVAWSFPVYPPEARAGGIQGVVALKVTITNTGTVEDVQVISGPQELRQSTIDAVKQWKFDPSWDHGYSVGVKTIGVIYSLPNVVPVVGPAPPADEAAAGVKQYGGDVKAPMIIYKVNPDYTELAKTDKVEGTVIVSLVVDEHGLPQHVKLLRGLGDGLDEKAVEAVKKYVFKPGTENDKPVAVYLNVEVKFQLTDSSAQTQGPILVATPNSAPAATALARGKAELNQMLADNPGAIGVQFHGDHTEHVATVIVPPQVANDAANGVKQVGGAVKGPVPIYQPEPTFSAEAKKAKFEGIVTVSIIVDQRGIPQNVHVTKGVGHGLDEKAVEAVKKYRFIPAKENGKPVAVYLNVEVNFEIF